LQKNSKTPVSRVGGRKKIHETHNNLCGAVSGHMCFLKEHFKLSSFLKEALLVGVELGCTSFEKTFKVENIFAKKA